MQTLEIIRQTAKIIRLRAGELKASSNPDEIIRILALGSCIALVIIDPKTKTVGMAHIALPEAIINLKKAMKLPGYFVDTGVKALLQALQTAGAGNTANYLVKLAGGANMADPNHTFNIGERNLQAIKKTLKKAGLTVYKKDVGGHLSRNISVAASNGQVTLSSPCRADWNL